MYLVRKYLVYDLVYVGYGYEHLLLQAFALFLVMSVSGNQVSYLQRDLSF